MFAYDVFMFVQTCAMGLFRSSVAISIFARELHVHREARRGEKEEGEGQKVARNLTPAGDRGAHKYKAVQRTE